MGILLDLLYLLISLLVLNDINIENLYIDSHINDNFGEKKLCLSWDLNLRSPVLHTGVLTIRPLRHKPLSYSYFKPRLSECNTILQFQLGATQQVGILFGFTLYQGSSTRGPPASFVRPGKGISQNTMRYEY